MAPWFGDDIKRIRVVNIEWVKTPLYDKLILLFFKSTKYHFTTQWYNTELYDVSQIIDNVHENLEHLPGINIQEHYGKDENTRYYRFLATNQDQINLYNLLK